VSVWTFIFSIAQCSFAVSIERRLDWQVVALDISLDFRKLGMAMASNIAMINTTIMISIRVKPFFVRQINLMIAARSFIFWFAV
jgi:hypothetical protein